MKCKTYFYIFLKKIETKFTKNSKKCYFKNCGMSEMKIHFESILTLVKNNNNQLIWE